MSVLRAIYIVLGVFVGKTIEWTVWAYMIGQNLKEYTHFYKLK